MRPSLHICIAVSLSITVGGCFVAQAGRFGSSGSTPARAGLGVRPAPVHQAVSTVAPPTTMRTLHLRIYADQDYRRQMPGWRNHATALVARASDQMQAVLGLRLTIDSMSEWERRANPADMKAILEELHELDRGDDMVRVVALVAALPEAAESYDQCGAANLGGRHLFVRSAGDVELFQRLKQRYYGDELDNIYHQRTLHKELVVMLHELAHTLGAEHVNDDGAIMFERYATTQQSFSDQTIEVMRRGLLDEATGHSQAGDETIVNSLRTDVVRALDDAAETKDPDEARAYLQQAEALLVNVVDAGDLWNRVARDYQLLSMPTMSQRALAHAGGQADATVAAWASVTRARFAIPDDGAAAGITPATEADYLDLARAALKEIQRGDYRRATAAIRKGAHRFPDAPGWDVFSCDIAMRRSQWKRARARCEHALARFDGASWGHFLLGVLDQQDGATDRAREHFSRALELDPDLTPARDRLSQLGR